MLYKTQIAPSLKSSLLTQKCGCLAFLFGWDLGSEMDNEVLPALEGSVSLSHLGFITHQIRAEHFPDNQRP